MWMKEWLKNRPRFSHENLLKELQLSSPGDYQNFLRMDYTTFSELLQMGYPNNIEARYNFTNCSITSFEDFKFNTAISPQSLGKIIIETCDALVSVLRGNIKVPKTEEEWKNVAEIFEKKWNFPHCVGAIDGKHVEIRKPCDTGSYYFNYKQTFSIVLMAMMNGNYDFIMVDVGANGRISDGGVFANTIFGKKLNERKLNIPEPETIGTPYSQRELTLAKRIYNYRLSRARRIVESVFGILAGRFRILLTTINLNPEKAVKIVMTCCHLHNYLRRKKGPYLEQDLDVGDCSGQIEQASCSSRTQLFGLKPSTNRNSSSTAKLARDRFCEYFNNAGAVPWQANMIK